MSTNRKYTWTCPEEECGAVIERTQPAFAVAVVDHKLEHMSEDNPVSPGSLRPRCSCAIPVVYPGKRYCHTCGGQTPTPRRRRRKKAEPKSAASTTPSAMTGHEVPSIAQFIREASIPEEEIMTATATKNRRRGSRKATQTGRKNTKAPVEKAERVPASRKLDLSLALKLRDKKVPIYEIAEKLGTTRGNTAYILLRHDYQNDPKLAKQRITGTPAAVAKKIVALREKGESWIEIGARADKEYAEVRKIYEDTTGKSGAGSAPGKTGGRPVNGSKPKTKKAPAKKAPAKTRNRRRAQRTK